jgi:hypothetical protein
MPLPPNGNERDTPWPQRELAPQLGWPVATGAGVIAGVIDTGVEAGATQQRNAHVQSGVDVTIDGSGSANTDRLAIERSWPGLSQCDPQPAPLSPASQQA